MQVLSFAVGFAVITIVSGCDDSARPEIDRNSGASSSSTAEGGQSGDYIPIFVTPYYFSEGLQISVGKFSENLSAGNLQEVKECVTNMREEWDVLPIEAMYVAAIRLYDLGDKHESVFWFYSAQYRARLFETIVDETSIRSFGSPDFERKHAYQSFLLLIGPYINKFAFQDPALLRQTLLTVASEGERLPKFTTIYPDAQFLPAARWQEKNEEIRQGLLQFAKQIEENGVSPQLPVNGNE